MYLCVCARVRDPCMCVFVCVCVCVCVHEDTYSYLCINTLQTYERRSDVGYIYHVIVEAGHLRTSKGVNTPTVIR